MNDDKIKNLAAKRWHRKARGKCSLSEAYSGGCYLPDDDICLIHEAAFVAGYKAAAKPKRKKAVP